MLACLATACGEGAPRCSSSATFASSLSFSEHGIVTIVTSPIKQQVFLQICNNLRPRLSRQPRIKLATNYLQTSRRGMDDAFAVSLYHTVLWCAHCVAQDNREAGRCQIKEIPNTIKRHYAGPGQQNITNMPTFWETLFQTLISIKKILKISTQTMR